MLNLFSLKDGKKEAQNPGNKKRASAAQLRITKDINELELPKTCKTEFPDADDLLNFKLIIQPDEGFYRGGKFTFSFKIGQNYPHEPPKVKCCNKVYHPNIDLEGNVCLNILREDWKPVLTINAVVYGLQYLFLEPNPDDPLNKEAANELQVDGMAARRVFVIPGNGSGDIMAANWYKWVRDQVLKTGTECIARNMPDPVLARMSIWIPFMRNELKIGEADIIIGHSSGACAAIRFAEKYPVHAIILVSAYTTDLGDENERESGYFDEPWEWEKVIKNCKNIIQFGSTDDPFLPWPEQQKVCDSLSAKLHRFENRGHFMSRAFPELVNEVKTLCQT